MSESDDALREMARNRGCRLVKSRRRKPGGDFGRYGLKDLGSGREVYGFGGKGLTGTPEDIAAFLRGGAAASWRGSLKAAGKAPTADRAASAKAEPAERGEAGTKGAPGEVAAAPKAQAKPRAPKPAPPPPPKPTIRDAKPRDAAPVAALIRALGYEVTDAGIRRDIARFAKAGTPVLVADLEGPSGCLTWHATPVIHRPRPVGRITMLVVAEEKRGGGLGLALVAEAEARLTKAGCGMVEVTSNMKRMRAHAFYEGLGYERTSYRFFRKLQD